VSLAELVRREFAPYVASNSTQIEGPDVTLVGEAGQVVAMVLHELVTNAAKYGALSTKHGRVSIRWFWQLNGTRRLSFRWQEIGGPIAAGPPTRSGYGMSVIRDLIPYELGGTADLAMKSEGVHCQLEIPVHWFAGDGGPDPSKVAPDPSVDISTFRRPQRA
jgi:two-component sensor histidine kinase